MLVFLLLLPLAVSVSQDAEVDESRKKLTDLAEYQRKVKTVLDLLGVSLDELKKTASRLVAANIVEKSKLDLSKVINRLMFENQRLRAENAALKMRTDELGKQKEAADRELARFGKAVGEGGTEPGSCWFAADGQVEYFLDVVISDQLLDLRWAWPSSRRDDLESMRISPSAIPSGELGNMEFSRFAEPVYFATVEQGCRLFARVVDSTTSKDAYKRQRKLVERYFFVSEMDDE